MKWHFIDDGAQLGDHNMEFDISLMERCGSDNAYFRIYQWEPYCISLGANQYFEDIDRDKAAAENIEITKRPTGGRAILHSEELTYSVVIPLDSGLKPREIYKKVSDALVRGLLKYDQRLSGALLEENQPDFPQLLNQPSGVMCFASTAKSEVKFKGKKLIGSAQRKKGRIVLQHGSILCGTFHRKLPEYLADSDNRDELKRELSDKTIEIETILGEKTDYSRLRKNLKEGFMEEWNIIFED